MQEAVPTRLDPAAQTKWLVLGILAVLLGLIVRDAWMTEDAYITLRTVDNVVNGYGLRWNIDERVQGYTHPLWMIMLTAGYAITREAYFTSIFIGVLTTFGALLVVMKLARTPWHAVAALTLLALSRAFVEFSTSGLENPLTHLLVGVFLYLYLVREAGPRALTLCASLLLLSRTDAMVVVAPALVHVAYVSYRERGWKETLRELAIGVSPYVAWEAFSLFYYGFPFPNTAYAKLNTGLPIREVLRQGVTYLLNGLAWDPPTMIVMGLGIAAGLLHPNLRTKLVVVGALLYLVYVVRIGGDFMQGRFLTLPMFASVCLVARASVEVFTPSTTFAWLAPFVFLYLHPSALEKYPIVDFQHSGIADERNFYRDGLAMMMFTRTHPLPNHWLWRAGLDAKNSNDKVRVYGNIGLYGFAAGPKLHVIDPIALTDPLLARLPVRYDPNWRVGHYIRSLPPGYVESAVADQCVMPDKPLCEYYDKLRLVTAGDLWSWQRIKTLVAMNFGAYEYLLDRDRYKYPGVVREQRSNFVTKVSEGSVWNGPGMHVIGPDGIIIALGKVSNAKRVLITADGNDTYDVEFRRGTKVIETISSPVAASGSARTRELKPSPSTSDAGFDSIWMRPAGGDGMYSVGYLRISP